ncbi:hypothetical protein ACFE04_027017 [Oxalis oulophora]
MASKQSTSFTFSLLFFIFFFNPTSGNLLPSLLIPSISHNDVCKYTPYSDFCSSILPIIPSFNIQDYANTACKLSIFKAQVLKSLLQYYRSFPLTPMPTKNALQDCIDLADLNIDYLSETLAETNGRTTLEDYEAYDYFSIMSAVITNHQTCYQGLLEASTKSSIMGGLASHISNATKHYSVALGLFKYGWVPKDVDHHGGSYQGGQRFTIPEIEPSIKRKVIRGVLEHSINVSQFVIVDPNGSGDFRTINEAVSAAPNNTLSSNGYYVIYVVAGYYEEYVNVIKQKKNLFMIGDGIGKTIITGNRNVVDGWTTFNSATFVVVGQNFVGVDLTIRNTAGPIKHQAVALRNGADMSTFYRCSLEAYQDTLYAHSLRQFYRECDIYGTVDFIFGNAAVVLQKCNIYPRQAMEGQFNTITAQGRTDPNQNTGTSIQGCNITATDELASSPYTVNTYLGRPWKEYSRTVYMESFMDSLIQPAGWSEWLGDFALSTLYYAEFRNIGPGADTSQRVKWPGYHPAISVSDAENFTVSNFIYGNEWLNQTGVPYNSGLLTAEDQ